MMPERMMSIDRIEGGIAILISRDDETLRLTIPARLLPPGAQEGDVLALNLVKDEAATHAAKERVSGLIDRLKKKS
jgi:hypothetical protein